MSVGPVALLFMDTWIARMLLARVVPLCWHRLATHLLPQVAQRLATLVNTALVFRTTSLTHVTLDELASLGCLCTNVPACSVLNQVQGTHKVQMHSGPVHALLHLGQPELFQDAFVMMCQSLHMALVIKTNGVSSAIFLMARFRISFSKSQCRPSKSCVLMSMLQPVRGPSR